MVQHLLIDMMAFFRTCLPLQDGQNGNSTASKAWDQLQAMQAAYAKEAARRPLPPADAQKDVRAAFKQLFGAACAALEREHASLLAKERNNLRTLTARRGPGQQPKLCVCGKVSAEGSGRTPFAYACVGVSPEGNAGLLCTRRRI
jgi:hypothetical protein